MSFKVILPPTVLPVSTLRSVSFHPKTMVHLSFAVIPAFLVLGSIIPSSLAATCDSSYGPFTLYANTKGTNTTEKVFMVDTTGNGTYTLGVSESIVTLFRLPSESCDYIIVGADRTSSLHDGWSRTLDDE